MQGEPFISSVYSLSPAARVEGKILNSVGGLRTHLVCDNSSVLLAGGQGLISSHPVSLEPQPFPGMTSSVETQLCRPLELSLTRGTGAVTDGDVTAQDSGQPRQSHVAHRG